MRLKFSFPVILLFLGFGSCSKSDDNTPNNNLPEAVDLIFPHKNAECSRGEIIDEEQSKITFEWSESLDADYYIIHLEGLSIDFTYRAETENTQITVPIKRGEAFSWYITSKSFEIEESTASETWNFFNSGPGITSHVPFPAEILSPSSGKVFASDIEKVVLEWSGSDLDNDIAEYELYFGKENPPLNKTVVGLEPKLEINVTSGNKYYWYILTRDNRNNVSKTSVATFEVE